jgi:hypothetical protein
MNCGAHKMVWRWVLPSATPAQAAGSEDVADDRPLPQQRSRRRLRHRFRKSRSGTASLSGSEEVPASMTAPSAGVMQSIPEESTYSRLCIVQRSTILDRAEAELGSALFVTVGGNRPAVTEHQVIEEVARSFRTDASVMSILMSVLEDFILVLPDIRVADRVLNNDPPLLRPSFSLLFKCWTRRALAARAAFLTAVDVELRGIPAHAWDKETVQQLLNGSC